MNDFSFGTNDAAEEMDTLADRLRRVMKSNGWSGRKWCRMAAIKEETHLATLLRRLDAEPEAGVDAWLIASLAKAAEVSIDWLLLGRGSMRAHNKMEPDPYPSRALVLAASSIVGVPAARLRQIEAETGHATDPGSDYWAGRVRGLSAGQGVVPKQLPAVKKVARRKKD